ncbi:MAG: hypothetical protein ABJN36_04585 [Cyclobacteriaceae bacterium]
MIIKNISILTVILILLLPVLALIGSISLDDMKMHMLIGSVLWFALAPFWIKKDS